MCLTIRKMPTTRSQARGEMQQTVSLTTIKAQSKRKLRTFLNTIDIQFNKKERHFRLQFQLYKKSVEHLYGHRVFCDNNRINRGTNAIDLKPFVPLFSALVTPVKKTPISSRINTEISKHIKSRLD
ncbi:hypothetical protein ACOME3_000580 [Neoechinorhynchus agilis]